MMESRKVFTARSLLNACSSLISGLHLSGEHHDSVARVMRLCLCSGGEHGNEPHSHIWCCSYVQRDALDANCITASAYLRCEPFLLLLTHQRPPSVLLPGRSSPCGILATSTESRGSCNRTSGLVLALGTF